MRVALVVALLAAVAGQVYSQESGDASAERPEESEFRFSPAPDDGVVPGGAAPGQVGAFGAGDLLRMLLVLLMVTGSVYGVIAFLRRRTPGKADESGSPIRILASRSIGNNRDLYAVMVGRQVFLIGGGDSALQLITTVEDQETIDELVLASSSGTSQAGQRTFGAVLGSWISNIAVPGTRRQVGETGEKGEASQIRSFLHLQQDRLRKIR